jgi:uncharacterized membrane protein HdeD (DUF308 family)
MTDEPANAGLTVVYSECLFPWWILFLWGILTLILGALFLNTPAVTAEVLITFMGAFWLVGGLFSIASLAVDRTHMGWKVFLAAINIIAGALILVFPVFTTVFILLVTAIYIGFVACIIGFSHLFLAFRRKDAGNGVIGIISLVFGILLLANPALTAGMLPFIAGAFCIVSGISAIIASIVAKKSQCAVKA